LHKFNNQNHNIMAIFKNKNFVKRDYEATNIVFCDAAIAPDANWIECDASEIEEANCTQLHTQAGVRYYGYL